MMKLIRVVIIEDHDDFREGLVHVLNFSDGFTCVGSFSSVESAIDELPETDVVLLDIHLPGKSGTDSIQEIKLLAYSAFVIMLTVFDDDENVFNAIMNGADGYILNKTPPTHVLSAIRAAAAGGTQRTPYVARRLI